MKNLMKAWPAHFIFHKVLQMTPASTLAPAALAILPKITPVEANEPNPIFMLPKNKADILCESSGGHYFMGGLPALMQAVRLLQKDPAAHVTYVNDGQIKKSTQSAHQGHVHPTEWTTPELGTLPLTKIILNSLHLYPDTPPEDVTNYSYVHFPLSKIRIGLFIRNIAFRIIHTLLSKNGVSDDDRWQCEAVRASLAFHKELSDEIVATGGKATYASGWRLIWSSDKASIEKKSVLWNELGIHTEPLSEYELRKNTLLRNDVPLYGLKVIGDGKFFADVEGKITAHLLKKYPNFTARISKVCDVYIDEATKEPFAVHEVLADGSDCTVLVDSFFGSAGHNQVFMCDEKKSKKTAMWDEVPVTGVSTLWVCTVPKKELLAKFEIEEHALIEYIKELVGAANLTNLHMTIWDACIDKDMVHIVIRATQGANFNSPLADPNDLYNMQANIQRFFIGTWTLITAGSCTRKTTTANVPEVTNHFIHGLSGIGFSLPAAPKEMLKKEPLTANLGKKLIKVFFAH